MITRKSVILIELMTARADKLRSKAEQLHDRLYDPVMASVDPVGGSITHDVRKREIMLTTYNDRIAEIRAEADAVQADIDKLREDLRQYLEDNKTEWAVKWIVIGRLVKGYTWAECAELTGYTEKTCKTKYDNWLYSLNSGL